jgi:hypothetical protein
VLLSKGNINKTFEIKYQKNKGILSQLKEIIKRIFYYVKNCDMFVIPLRIKIIYKC